MLTLLSIIFSSLSILTVGLIGLLITLYIINYTKLNKANIPLYKLLIIIFLINILSILILYFGYENYFGLPYYDGGSDDLKFEIWAKQAIKHGLDFPWQYSRDLAFRSNNSKGFVWLISLLMRINESLGGYHTISFRVLNVNFLISIGVLATSYFAKHYKFGKTENSILLLFVTLFPNMMYLSNHVFRDTLISLILFYVFYIWDDYLTDRKNGILLLLFKTILITYFSFWVREQSVFFIGIIIIINVLLKENYIKIKNIFIYTGCLLLVLILAQRTGLLEEVLSFNENYTEHKLSISDGLTTHIFSISLFPFGIILRFLYGLLFPIPLQLLNILRMFSNIDMFYQVLISFGSVIQIYLLPYLFRNFKKMDKLFILYNVFLIGIVITTFTFRHFVTLYPYMFILIFRQYFLVSKKGKTINLIIVSMALILLLTIYMILSF
ncbi:hypothetical protein [Ruoffia sp. FAM 26254]|uniref:hypothetical protein n=1 Tax=Ruoffia sp. FAM 26254 TaxID=3259518 RepID=UPI00388A6444